MAPSVAVMSQGRFSCIRLSGSPHGDTPKPSQHEKEAAGDGQQSPATARLHWRRDPTLPDHSCERKGHWSQFTFLGSRERSSLTHSNQRQSQFPGTDLLLHRGLR